MEPGLGVKAEESKNLAERVGGVAACRLLVDKSGGDLRIRRSVPGHSFACSLVIAVATCRVESFCEINLLLV